MLSAAGEIGPAVAPTRRPTRAHVIANVVLFQLAWFACILGAAHGRPWLGTAAVAAVVAWHFGVVARPAREARLVAAAMVVGFAFDSGLAASGWVHYASGQWVPWLAPQWIVALWALLAVTLNVSMRWLHGRLAWAAVLGAVASPMSYAAGVRLGGAVFVEPVPAIAMLAVGWFFLMPAMVALARRWDGVGAAEVQGA